MLRRDEICGQMESAISGFRTARTTQRVFDFNDVRRTDASHVRRRSLQSLLQKRLRNPLSFQATSCSTSSRT
jgi:hypothetical protein